MDRLEAVTEPPTAPLFGDVLARARLSWVLQMADRVARFGHDDYRRSDAIVLRHLLRGPASVGQLGAVMGVTRQAARKVVGGLEERGYATTARDEFDGRRLKVVLTPAGAAYGRDVVEVVGALNRALGRRVDPGRLDAAREVLQEVVALGEADRAPAG